MLNDIKIPINKTFLSEDVINNLKNVDITSYEIADLFGIDLANYCNSNYGLVTNSATTAIWLGLMALSLKEGDEVLIPGYSYPSVIIICKFMKLNYKCIDIKLDTLCMDPKLIKENITKNTKAVIFINHLGYFGPDVFEIKQICDEYNCYFIEDSSNGLGVKYNNIMCGTIGEFGVYSFNWHKLIRASGGGGFITNNKKLFNKVKEYAWPLHLNDDLKFCNFIGGIGTFNMPPLNAYIGIKELKKADELIEKRNKVFNIYKKYLNIFSYDNNNSTSECVYLSDNAEKIYYALKENKIESEYRKFKYYGDGINSKKIFNKYITLPYSYDLTENDIKIISNIINKVEKIRS